MRRATITWDNEDLEPISCPFCGASMDNFEEEKKFQMTKIVGIDYSLTETCIAICDNVIDINETEFHYLTK